MTAFTEGISEYVQYDTRRPNDPMIWQHIAACIHNIYIELKEEKGKLFALGCLRRVDIMLSNAHWPETPASQQRLQKWRQDLEQQILSTRGASYLDQKEKWDDVIKSLSEQKPSMLRSYSQKQIDKM